DCDVFVLVGLLPGVPRHNSDQNEDGGWARTLLGVSVDPRTPVIVGAGQINDRELGSEPIDLMVRCSEAALADTGAGDALRSRIEAVRVVWGVWPYADPGRLVAEQLGCPDAVTTKTAAGGNQVYDLVIQTAEQIRSGALDVAVVCAA